MSSLLMRVFYDENGLPYKDKELTIHYPIIGNTFMGSSNVKEIRFYIANLGNASNSWVANAKLPNGQIGSKLLSIGSDEYGTYASLSIDSWYTQHKGDIYISLNGYRGGVEFVLDEDSGLYVVSPTYADMVINVTGSIKLSINYATQTPSDYESILTVQQALLALGTKLDIIKGIVVVDNANSLTESFDNGQLLYSKNDNKLYVYNSGIVTLFVNPAENNIGFIIKNDSLDNNLTASQLVEANKDFCLLRYDGNVYFKTGVSGLNNVFIALKEINETSGIITFSDKAITVARTNGNCSNSNSKTFNTYSKTQAESIFAMLSGNNEFSGDNTFKGQDVFDNSPQTNETINDSSSGTKLATKSYVANKIGEVNTDIGNVRNRVSAIESKIPSQADAQNQLADKDFVNSTVNSLVAYYITKNAQGDPFSTYAELISATTFYSGGNQRTPTRNDYCLVLADETHPIQANNYTAFNNTNDYVGYYVSYNGVLTLVTHYNKDSLGIVAGTTIAYITNASTCRYIYQGSQWEFQYVVNETPFTSDQIKALNSGITDALVAQITTNQNAIATINSKLPITKDFVIPTTAWSLIDGKYVAVLDSGIDFVINDNAVHIYTPTSDSDQLIRDMYGINVSSNGTTQKFTFVCNLSDSAPTEVINFTIAQFGGN